MINHDERESRFSSLVDSLLVTYSQVDPRPGLETRILDRLRSAVARRRQQRMLIVAASVAVILFIALNTTRSPEPRFAAQIASPRAVQRAPLAASDVTAARPYIASKLGTNRKPRRWEQNTLVLRLASSIEGGHGSVFQQENSQISPDQPPEEEASTEWQTAVSDISTQNSTLHLGESKDQVPQKNTD